VTPIGYILFAMDMPETFLILLNVETCPWENLLGEFPENAKMKSPDSCHSA
jgi:hypothetical protein